MSRSEDNLETGNVHILLQDDIRHHRMKTFQWGCQFEKQPQRAAYRLNFSWIAIFALVIFFNSVIDANGNVTGSITGT